MKAMCATAKFLDCGSCHGVLVSGLQKRNPPTTPPATRSLFDIVQWFTLCSCLVFLISCGDLGGTETGNPSDDLRTVTGTVPASTTTSLNKAMLSSGCSADAVQVEDSEETTTTALVESDCTFSVSVSVGTEYILSFLQEEATVGVLRPNAGSALLTLLAMRVSRGSGGIVLGQIAIANFVATPQNEPANQNDQDADGISDLLDDDDDGDGTLDVDEADCDLDGFFDDVDGDISSCSNNAATVRIRQVSPHSDRTFMRPARRVSSNRPIRIRAACDIDESSVSSATLQVTAENDTVQCALSFSSSGRRVECDHDDDPFMADTIYTATVDGLFCDTGERIESRSWSWKTRGN